MYIRASLSIKCHAGKVFLRRDASRFKIKSQHKLSYRMHPFNCTVSYPMCNLLTYNLFHCFWVNKPAFNEMRQLGFRHCSNSPLNCGFCKSIWVMSGLQCITQGNSVSVFVKTLIGFLSQRKEDRERLRMNHAELWEISSTSPIFGIQHMPCSQALGQHSDWKWGKSDARTVGSVYNLWP